MILGISASPRPEGVTASAVKRVLAETKQKHEYISLAGKTIAGCISCLGCSITNRCVVKDDFPEIAEKLVTADAIVFGAPNYYRGLGSLGNSFWERCFCFRHMGKLEIGRMPAVLISTGHIVDEANDPVLDRLLLFMMANEIEVVSKFGVKSVPQCYDCKPGIKCSVGNVVKDHGYVEKITSEMRPKGFDEQPESIEKAVLAASILKGRLEGKYE